MLTLKGITKEYVLGNGAVTKALKGIDLEFRRNEFAAVLGQSGCGKTTLLNIIGGLDGYTDGDLFINRKSTKAFAAGDWDSYRNSSVGFVFQSYNLIMHQTVLQNVELALTLIGLPKAERTSKAMSALKKVGLLDQRDKKPNQMSGGQMQRVAIARAIVNDPEILLADEPTGALDTESSVQIMDILKSVAEDRLVIMVTHNPELAEQYATRIINLKEGMVASDTNPFTDEAEFITMDKRKARRHKFKRIFKEFFVGNVGNVTEDKSVVEEQPKTKKRRKDKTSMHFSNALKLSFSNLTTKKLRTSLTAFAGSIGIIGIALVLALSTGVSAYLSSVEEDSLATHPIEINQMQVNMSTILDILKDKKEYEDYPTDDEIHVSGILSNITADTLLSMMSENDIASFKKYLDANFDDKDGYYSYSYDTKMRIYSQLEEDRFMKVNPVSMSGAGFDVGSILPPDVMNVVAGNMQFWGEMSNNQTLLESQYDIVGSSYGSRWPTETNEVVVVVDSQNKLDDFSLFSLGLLAPEDALGIIDGTIKVPDVTIETLLGLEYKLMANSDFYEFNEATGLYEYSLKDNEENMDAELIKARGQTLKVVGVVRAKEGVNASAISGVLGYSSDLVAETIAKIDTSEVVDKQRESETKNIVTGESITTKKGLENALIGLGVVDINDPNGIKLYANSFAGKEHIINLIDEYNAKVSIVDEDKEIAYSDNLTMIMGYVSTLTNTITGVLIGFSAISLIVSSIMISIITYTSVLERTKEIGVLRSLGARKRDISRVFNAETAMIGFMSGTIGVVFTAIVCIPINIILKNQFGIEGLAQLNVFAALALVAISIVISNIAGFLPSRMAASSDPVKALRTE